MTISLRRITAGLSAAAVLTALTAYVNAKETALPPPTPHTNSTAPADIARSSTSFDGTRCEHGHRVLAAYHGDDPYGAALRPDDPTCRR